MTAQERTGSESTEPYQARYEGFWTRLTCEACEATFDVEGDVSNGEFYDCDSCGITCEVTGR